MSEREQIGRIALRLALEKQQPGNTGLPQSSVPTGVQAQTGRVGTMKASDVISSILTAARRGGLVTDSYRSEHALYAATTDAMHGICRGQIALGEIMRTAALRFAVVRGPGVTMGDGDWIAVAIYGTIGSPTKGHEHEVAGLGLSPL